MAHVMKSKRGAVYNLLAHDDRSQEHIGNKDVNPDLSTYNINLLHDKKTGWKRYNDVMHRQDVYCLKRADVNTLISWVITSPFKEDEIGWELINDFFGHCNDFLTDRYGVRMDDGTTNIVSTVIHTDETSPHMHFKFVPLVEDSKRGGYKVDAKSVVNKADLCSFHTDLQKYLDEHDCPFQIVDQSLTDKNYDKSIADLKRETKAMEYTRRQELDDARQEYARLRAEIASKTDEKEKLVQSIEKLQKMEFGLNTRLQGMIDQCQTLEEGLIATEKAKELLKFIEDVASVTREEHLQEFVRDAKPKNTALDSKIRKAKTQYRQGKPASHDKER